MSDIVIKIENLSKQYYLGTISRGTLSGDLRSWWARVRGKEDPNAPVTHSPPFSIPDSTVRNTQFATSNPDTFWALNNISFDVKKGEILGIIGRNGAGKSTLLKIISQVASPTKGSVKIRGRVGSLLEIGTGFHPELTGRENVYLNGTILGMRKKEIDKKFEEIVAFSGVEDFIDTPVKRYSSGMHVRLGFAVAAHLDPEILIIDEVLAVGDAEFQNKCLGKMKNVAGEGRTVLFVSHNMAAVKNLCLQCMMIEKGRIRELGTSDRVVAKYLNQNLIDGAIASELEISKRMEGVIDYKSPAIRFKEIAITDSSGNPRRLFYSDEEIILTIQYTCSRPVQDLQIFMEIVDENNLSILGSRNVDDPASCDKFLRVAVGTYYARCTLPANVFGEKTFFISVHLIYPRAEHLVLNKILSFEVKFKGYNNQFGGANVFIRPQLNWTME